ncbi:NYN domain-containing protein [Microbacterium sp. 10M-3C3]|jgi:hypothetical protein|uniref:NYN domain-containing protein n=1 Tax=Microbacterium sp. 10M-3C3 TaxID=2483401 RepID=UPI000F6430FC|nr:NYN domain-containing protein [Microbacterium sp. 10M-3C3]
MRHLDTVPTSTIDDADVRTTAPRRVRTVHAIDLENQLVTRGRRMTTADAARWWAVYRDEAVGVGPDDLVFVGVSVHTTRELRPAFEGDRVMWRIGHAGPDGADLALLSALYAPQFAGKYRRLVIASGDHIFAPLARHAREVGMKVQLVHGRNGVSSELAALASTRTTIRPVARSQEARALSAIRLVHTAATAA